MSRQRSGAPCASFALFAALLAPGLAVANVEAERSLLQQRRSVQGPEVLSAGDSDNPGYNKETKLHKVKVPAIAKRVPLVGRLDDMELSYEILFASLYICFIGCVPVVLARLEPEGNKGYVAIAQVAALVVWLVGGLVLLTNTIKFQSSHWSGFRSLTVVETVYLFSQIITTVGYGDITPAYQRGQVVIGFYVLVSLLLIANMVSEVSAVVVKRVKHFSERLASGTVVALKTAGSSVKRLRQRLSASKEEEQPAQSDERHEQSADRSEQAVDYLRITSGVRPEDMKARLDDGEDVKLYEQPHIDFFPIIATSITFLIFMIMGVCFYHYFPGEDKTWFQGIYMSIITLSTVGFGVFNATTEGGKVFGAFWMLFGVAALGSLVFAFTELLLMLKEWEKWDPESVRSELQENLGKAMEDKQGTRMNRYEFIKFALLQCNYATEEQLAAIEEEWDRLTPKGMDPATATHNTKEFKRKIKRGIRGDKETK